MELIELKYSDHKLENNSESHILFSKDKYNREIFFYKIIDGRIVGNSLFYPNCLIYSHEKLFNPLEEKIMSLNGVNNQFDFNVGTFEKVVNYFETPVFFFIYNTDNYYHFIYDTLPYLITFFHLKSKIYSIKLLMNYPNSQSTEFYKFVKEFLKLLNIGDEDIIIVDPNTIYKNLYVSSSYTHGIDSNLPPRTEIYDLYNKIVTNIKSKGSKKPFPKKIYVSRRTHLNSDKSNIGTDYTSKRKMVNEDELVNYLSQKGFSEVFTENYSTEDKILMFANAEHVVGAVGGGLCNVLFSQPECKLTAIISPTFLDVNYRFKYSLDGIDVTYFQDTIHDPDQEWKKYMRVQIRPNDIVGEIVDISEKTLTISYTDEFVAGWNNTLIYKTIVCNKTDCEKLDNGLNSPFKMNMETLKQLI